MQEHPVHCLTPEDWHEWFVVQAGWTQATRAWLYRQSGITQAGAILEVGCGTGAITQEVTELGPSQVVGLDLDPAVLALARVQTTGARYVRGDAHYLPFPDSCFDAVLCHYLLLWLADPEQGVREMTRVVRLGGCVLACAEPDYGGRVDYPPELAQLGRLQVKALRQQGARPEIGRRLAELFSSAGLQTTLGVMAGSWSVPATPDAGFEAEWKTREHDLGGSLSQDELFRLRVVDREALSDGRRVLFVPTFHARGWKTR